MQLTPTSGAESNSETDVLRINHVERFCSRGFDEDEYRSRFGLQPTTGQ